MKKVIVLIASIGLLAAACNSKTDVNTNANLKNYSNDKYGYSIQYPSSWGLTDSSTTFSTINLFSNNHVSDKDFVNGQDLHIQISAGFKADGLLEYLDANYLKELRAGKGVKINGIDATQAISTGSESYLITQGDETVVISVFKPIPEAYRNDSTQILNSFKFTK